MKFWAPMLLTLWSIQCCNMARLKPNLSYRRTTKKSTSRTVLRKTLYFSGVTSLTAAEPHFRNNISNITVTCIKQKIIPMVLSSIQVNVFMLCRCIKLSTHQHVKDKELKLNIGYCRCLWFKMISWNRWPGEDFSNNFWENILQFSCF